MLLFTRTKLCHWNYFRIFRGKDIADASRCRTHVVIFGINWSMDALRHTSSLLAQRFNQFPTTRRQPEWTGEKSQFFVLMKICSTSFLHRYFFDHLEDRILRFVTIVQKTRSNRGYRYWGSGPICRRFPDFNYGIFGNSGGGYLCNIWNSGPVDTNSDSDDSGEYWMINWPKKFDETVRLF